MLYDNNLIRTICILLLLYIVYINRKHIFRNTAIGGSNYFVLWFVITFFSTFYILEGGDNYSVYLSYVDYMETGNQYHLEPFYYWLMDMLPNNYHLFRFVIWGSASLFTVLTFKKLNCQSPLATLIFISTCLITCFYYLRNVLGFSILYYVTACITTYKYKNLHKLLIDGFFYSLMIWATFYLHTSMPLYYLVIILSLLIPYNKYVLIIIFFFFSFLGSFFPSIVDAFLYSSLFSDEARELGERYLEVTETANYNFNGILGRILWLSPYFIILVYTIFFSNKDRWSRSLKTFLFASVLLLSFSFLFRGMASYSLQLRLLHTSFMPMSFFLAQYLENKRNKIIGYVFSGLILLYYVINALLYFLNNV